MDGQREGGVQDVVVVGGGAAGLSAALTLARSRRSVTVIDAGQPRNAAAQAAHGLLGLEGVNPLALLTKGRDEAASYGAHILSTRLTSAAVTGRGFTVTLDDGNVAHTRQLLVATGVIDELPDIPGLRERWGRDVVHCPYCHGWEIRDQQVGLLATGPMSAMQALLFRQWSADVRFFPNGLDVDQRELAKLTAVGIQVTNGIVSSVEVTDDRLTGVVMQDGNHVELEALAVPARTRVRLEGLTDLGLETSSNAMGTAIVADAVGHTSIPGVWAAGNAVNPAMQISEAAASGARAAMTINTELVLEEADRASSRAQQPDRS